MLLSALEALLFLILTIRLVWMARWRTFAYSQSPDVLFCMVFALVFAFAVGVSTFNFGTLSRYKIPMMPYFLLAVALIDAQWKRERKFAEFASME